MRNPFEKNTGSLILQHPIAILLVLLAALLVGKLMALYGIPMIALLFILPFIVIYLNRVLLNPKIALFTLLIVSYFINGLSRYTGDYPFGIVADLLFILTIVALFLKNFNSGINWKPMLKDISLLAVIWMAWLIIELFNPEVISYDAWFPNVRSIGFYFLLGIPLVLLLMRKPKDLEIFLYIWGAMTILTTMKGIMQLFWGLDSAEQSWINAGAHNTHVLFGRLRVFSFLSDAGQFGASQGHAFVIGSILAYETKKWGKKIFFGSVALFGLYGLAISGTRGAIAVPVMGFATYLVLSKDIRLISAGFLGAVALYIFFAHTHILQSNYQIKRMRSAIHPTEDASFQVRLDNQKILKLYLASRPMGGGVGHGGTRAKQYLPDEFLSTVATDSWYVLIWAENGAIGLAIHFFILFYIVLKSGYYIMFRVKDYELRARMMAIHSGIMGILLANYGNAVMGQFPTSIIVYYGMGFLFLATYYDKIVAEQRKEGIDPFKLINFK